MSDQIEDDSNLTDEQQEAQEALKADALAELDSKAPEVEARVGIYEKTQGKRNNKQLYRMDFDGHKPPERLWKCRRIGDQTYKPEHAKEPVKGIVHIPGRGCYSAPVMFIGASAWGEEIIETIRSGGPQALKGTAGTLFMRNLERLGFRSEDWFYTYLVKYSLRKFKDFRPMDARWGTPALVDELQRIKPQIIVCMDRQPFDWIMDREAKKAGTKVRKLKLRDVQGAWFDSQEFKARVYPMDSIGTPLWKPECLERFLLDLKEVLDELDAIRGVPRVQIVQNYVEIRKHTELIRFMHDEILDKGIEEVAIDCEWHGQTAYGGNLRSFQICPTPGRAAYVRLMDEKLKYAFDCPPDTMRKIMSAMTRQRVRDPETGKERWKLRFIGHNASADMPWLDHQAGIDVYQRFSFDTMYAQHTINEYSDLKLERLAVRYTDLGRYDLDMTLWKKDHKFDEKDNEGYGKVPDRIIIPYAQRDADATLRIKAHLVKHLEFFKLKGYYERLLLPFVTDGFYEMVDFGLPIDVVFLDSMREVFTRNQKILIQEFRKAVAKEANVILMNIMQKHDPDNWGDAYLEIQNLCDAAWNEALHQVDTSHRAIAQARETFKIFMGQKKLAATLPVFEHKVVAPMFNLNSPAHLKGWLFDAKKLKPIKTTKLNGIQLSWDKVLAIENPVKRSEYQPSTDKQVLKVYAEHDPIVAQLQELKTTAQIVKGFLRGPDEEGKEQGLHRWVQPDGRIHANFSLTETARPRAWKPNILNFPKAITRPIEAAFRRANKVLYHEEYFSLKAQGLSPLEIKTRIMGMREVPSVLRANVQAPPGWTNIDMDLKSAEIVALFFQSMDRNGMKVLTEWDTQFARTDWKNEKKYLRIAYNENSGYPQTQWDPRLVVSKDDPRLIRTPDGNLVHPKRDLHWEIGEVVAGLPREKCDERMHRDGCGKIGNFCLLHSSRCLTQRGEVPIQDVKPDDLLWDGQEWVSHGGVVCNGIMETHFYQGLWATDNHEVWITDGRKITFGEARRRGLDLFRPTAPFGTTPTQVGAPDSAARNVGSIGQRSLRSDDPVPVLWSEVQEICRPAGERKVGALCLCEQRQLSRSSVLYFEDALCSNGSTLRKGFKQIFSILQGEGDQGEVQVLPGVCGVGVEKMARHGFQGIGIRSEGQQWRLHKGECSIGDPKCESIEHDPYQTSQSGNRPGIPDATPRSDLYGDNDSNLDGSWFDRGAATGEMETGSTCGMAEVQSQNGQAPLTRVGLVYDILNVGPRHRFTCSGVLVSNSIPYGAAGPLLERLIEANTGKKPPPRTGELMIDSWKARYPEATTFLHHMEQIVDKPGYWRSLSERVRHFQLASIKYETEGGDRGYAGIASSLRRQARNFPMQELVAATTSTALIRFIEERRKLNMQARIGVLLYDAITAFCPLTEAKVATELLKKCLTEINWFMDRTKPEAGTFHFDVDVTYSFRWGVKMTKAEQAQLQPYLE